MHSLFSVWLLLVWALAASAPQQAAAALPAEFVALPPELGSRAPARLCFSVTDLAQCWNDETARRCVLRAPIRVEEPIWRRLFASTGGVAVQAPPLDPLTLTSEPCSMRGGCLGAAPSNSTERTQHSQQQAFDLQQLPGLMRVGSGGVLSFVNLHLLNVAPRSAYVYDPAAAPFKADGIGTGLFSSVQFAPNSTLLVANCSVLFTNPSATDTCAAHMQRSLFAFQQIYGVGNITANNSTASLVVGPVIIFVTVRDGASNIPLGVSTSSYMNVSFACMERPDTPPAGIGPGELAAAIAVPVAVTVLAAGLLLAWCVRRRKQQQRSPAAGKGLQLQPLSGVKDVEAGGAPAGSGQGCDAPQATFDAAASVPYSFGGSSALWSSPSNITAATASSVDVEAAGGSMQLHSGQSGQHARPHSSRSLAPVQHASRQPAVAPAQRAAALQLDTAQVRQAARGSAAAPAIASSSDRQQSTSTAASGTPKSSLEVQQGAVAAAAAAGTGSISGAPMGASSSRQGSRPSSGSTSTERQSAVQAMLKARSDVAVLRELKIGPLLGRGSYGQVYRGRWKATTVAVKIIEHYGVDADASSGSRRLSAGREMLFATSMSHPNLVTCFHVSTMTVAQRSALARTWLADSGVPQDAEDEEAAAATEASGGDSETSRSGSGSGSGSSDTDGGPAPDLLETWVIMEFAEKGSLERALKLGKFKLSGPSAQEAEMVGIYKALLDTASGLDYLHSIGVVHGDLKTANVLLKGSSRDARGVTCKITDFGLSKVLDSENQTHISTATYGTIVYMPKELLLSGRMTQATDIYSFGLMMWELFTSQPVMDEGLSIGQMFYMIAYQDWRPEVPPDCPSGYAELMAACWHDDPEQRPTAQQLLQRLQRLYAQAKQRLIAARAAKQALQAAGAAAAGPPDRPSIDSTASVSLLAGTASSAIGSPTRLSLNMEAAHAFLDTQCQQQQQQPVVSTQQQQPALHAQAGTGRRSQDSAVTEEVEAERSYEPFVHAVLHRATSLAVPPRDSMAHSPGPAAAEAAAVAAAAFAAAEAAVSGATPTYTAGSSPVSPFSYNLCHLQQQQRQGQPSHWQLPVAVQTQAGWVQLLPAGGADPNSSLTGQPFAREAGTGPAFTAVEAPASSDSCLPAGAEHTTTNSSAGMYSGSADYFADAAVEQQSCLLDGPALQHLQQQYQQQYQQQQYQQQQQHEQQQLQAIAQAMALQQQQQLAEEEQQRRQQQQQARGQAPSSAAAARYWPSYMDALPPAAGAPDFAVTEDFLATIEWACRPEVQAAASAAAAQTLAAMRAQAEADGTLDSLPSYIRDPIPPAPTFYFCSDQQGADQPGPPVFPDPRDAGQNRLQAYITALDMARSPSALIAATDAIIADAVAVDAALNSSSSSSPEPDAAVDVDSLTMLPYTSGQQGYYALSQPPVDHGASASQSRLAAGNGTGVVPADAAGAAAQQQAAVVAAPASAGGSKSTSSSANVDTAGGAGYSSNSTAARSWHEGSSSGAAGATHSSSLYGPPPWLVGREQPPVDMAAARRGSTFSPVQAATLSGSLRIFAGQPSAAAAAATAAMPPPALFLGQPAAAAATGAPSLASAGAAQQDATTSRWGLVPDSQADHTAQSSATGTGVASSGSFAAWGAAASSGQGSVSLMDAVCETE